MLNFSLFSLLSALILKKYFNLFNKKYNISMIILINIEHKTRIVDSYSINIIIIIYNLHEQKLNWFPETISRISRMSRISRGFLGKNSMSSTQILCDKPWERILEWCRSKDKPALEYTYRIYTFVARWIQTKDVIRDYPHISLKKSRVIEFTHFRERECNDVLSIHAIFRHFE